MKLYEIADSYKNLMNEIDNAYELTVDQLELIEKLNDDVNTKAINVAAFIKNLESEAEMIYKAESDMLERRHKIIKKANSLRDYLKDSIAKCNIKEIKHDQFDIKIKQNPCSVQVIDEIDIPSEYFEVTTNRNLNKRKILCDLKSGMNIRGVELKKNTRIEIK